ncbi:MAG: iron hydrogenase small subunit [Bacilli bacterium]|nr:iron hydrogenase small subunit [Bacilli bacterium]
MEKNICEKCGYEIINSSLVCPNCGYKKGEFDAVSDNEIDAIIDSVIDDALENVDSKIININEDQKFISIDSLDSMIYRINDKCINCGQCRKTCENKANIRYDLNKCKKPICIDCGQCIISCPSKALCIKEDYREVKDILDANEKVVVAVVTPEIQLMIKELYGEDELKYVEGLKKIGFDYIFNGKFGCELYSMELVEELVERINRKEELPIFSSSCPSWIKYTEIYHPELIKNISTCKNPLVMQCEAIKNYFSKEKGFDKEKIVTVGITTCYAKKRECKEYNYGIDYVLLGKEIEKLFEEMDIKIESLIGKEYDKMLSCGSNETALFCYSGGETYSIIKKLYNKITNISNNDISILDVLKNNEHIKEIKIPVGIYEIKILVVNQMKYLEQVLEDNKYKEYHYIEIMNCNDGCVGSTLELMDSEIKNKLFDSIKSKCVNIKNDEINDLYKKLLNKPYSPESIGLLHTMYSDKSGMLNNK